MFPSKLNLGPFEPKNKLQRGGVHMNGFKDYAG